MLPKLSRLNLKKDFERIASGKRLETKYMRLYFREGDPSAHSDDSGQASSGPRIGIASSSKVFRKAVDRNRARRLTSSVFESIYTHLPTRLNIVALPKMSILGVKSTDVLEDLEKKLRDEKIIN